MQQTTKSLIKLNFSFKKDVKYLLGERIKHYRKAKKLTLSQLAGQQMTKGMLSLIENNKANPSLENLEYIASQLDVSLSDLLSGEQASELRNLLLRLEKELTIEVYEDKDQLKTWIEEIKPFLSMVEHTYEYARMIELYAICLFYSQEDNYHEYFKKSANLYHELNMTTKELSIRVGMISTLFIEKKYEESYLEIKKLTTNLDYLYSHVEPLSKLEIAFHHAAFSFALGKLEEGFEVIDQALKLSAEEQIYYYIGEMYRLAASTQILFQEKKYSPYLDKLRLYGQFSEDFQSILATEVLENCLLFNDGKYKESYIHAVQQIARVNASMQLDTTHEHTVSYTIYLQFFTALKGRSLYKLNSITEAMEVLQSVTIPKITNYPLDINALYLSKYYLAKCYLKINNVDKAKQVIDESLKVLNDFPYSPTKELFLQLNI